MTEVMQVKTGPRAPRAMAMLVLILLGMAGVAVEAKGFWENEEGVCDANEGILTVQAETVELKDSLHLLRLNKDFFFLQHNKGSVNISWGLTLPDNLTVSECGEGDYCRDFGVAKVIVTREDHCHKVSWTAVDLKELRDCVHIEGHWYGGGEQVRQPWPLEKNSRKETAFVTADMLQKRTIWYGGVTEPYWVSSQGVAIHVDESTPLFFSVNTVGENQLCYAARRETPFSTSTHLGLGLNYHVCSADDVRQVHEATFAKFFQRPNGIPDERMFRDPIWSTWAKYHTAVDETKVFDFAMDIKAKGFNNSQVEIDDNWETCYGDAIFNPERFPDPKGLVDKLHLEGFRVTLWIHPFINHGCESYKVADQMGYFIKDSSGQTQLTHWWQGTRAGIVDFTNPEAVQWWSGRLRRIRQETGIDSFKFDAGESSWLPKEFTLGVDELYWPNAYTLEYADAVSEFGGMIETRIGRGTQRHPYFVRMLDKDSVWGTENGLRTLVPTLLHFGLLGYPFVLPDMIGGNAYVLKPSKELFIRWMQANVFMPSLQFSILPWDFDEEVTQMALEATSLHAEFTPLLLSLAKEASETGAPILRPTWWLCTNRDECLTADQQFLLGDDVLVAPVVHKGASTLDVVLPPGTWELQDTGSNYDGPRVVTLQNIDLKSIIYFTRKV